ncbi:hypothetical protein ACH9D2_03070 [Kocuria sp. M4R2S49]|uniref:hypothetical protein n=1 Tax=Kocuria rhizosphaericola TaxID=3376284 RepID=UPI003796DE36
MLTGRASQAIATALRRHGYELVAAPGSFPVSSAHQLLPDEEARARPWGAEPATRI